MHHSGMPSYQLVFEHHFRQWEMYEAVFAFSSYDNSNGIMMFSSNSQDSNYKISASARIISHSCFTDRKLFSLYINQTTKMVRLVLQCYNNSATQIKELINYDAESDIEFQPQNWFATIPEDYGEKVPIIINTAQKVQSYFVFNGIAYNGANRVEISQIDCGEF